MEKYCCAKDLSVDETYPSKSSLMTKNSNDTETKCTMGFYNIYSIRSLIYPFIHCIYLQRKNLIYSSNNKIVFNKIFYFKNFVLEKIKYFYLSFNFISQFLFINYKSIFILEILNTTV